MRVSATFTDGSTAGPVDGSRTCEAESLAPLEAFQVEIVPVEAARSVSDAAQGGTRARPVPPRGPTAAKPAIAPVKPPARVKPATPVRRK